MDRMLEELKTYGADLDGAMARFLNDVELYKSCFTAVLGDRAFPQLGQALAAQDYQAAFDCAHTLKGVVGNMGLTPLYCTICSMVEALRAHVYTSLEDDYAQILLQLDTLRALEA